MKTATGLTLIAIGAIATLAVRVQAPGINLRALGVIITATGVAGLFLRGQPHGWLRRRIVLRRGTAEPGAVVAEDIPYSPDAPQDPVILASQLLDEAALADAAGMADVRADDIQEYWVDEQAPAYPAEGSRAAAVLDEVFRD